MSDAKSSNKVLGLINKLERLIGAPPHQGPGLSQQTPLPGLSKKKKETNLKAEVQIIS